MYTRLSSGSALGLLSCFTSDQRTQICDTPDQSDQSDQPEPTQPDFSKGYDVFRFYKPELIGLGC